MNRVGPFTVQSVKGPSPTLTIETSTWERMTWSRLKDVPTVSSTIEKLTSIKHDVDKEELEIFQHLLLLPTLNPYFLSTIPHFHPLPSHHLIPPSLFQLHHYHLHYLLLPPTRLFFPLQVLHYPIIFTILLTRHRSINFLTSSLLHHLQFFNFSITSLLPLLQFTNILLTYLLILPSTFLPISSVPHQTILLNKNSHLFAPSRALHLSFLK